MAAVMHDVAVVMISLLVVLLIIGLVKGGGSR